MTSSALRFCRSTPTFTVHHGALAYLLGINALRASELAAVTVPVLRVLEACRVQRTRGPLVLRPISGQPIDRRDAYRLVTRIAKAARIPRHISPHSLRAWTAITMARAGGETRRVKLIDDPAATLTSDPGILRQLAVAGLGHDEPTLLITNDLTSPPKKNIESHARGMNMNSASPKRSDPSAYAPDTLQRRFLSTAGEESKTTTTRSSSASTAVLTHPCYAKPTSPPPKSLVARTPTALRVPMTQTGVESAARESALASTSFRRHGGIGVPIEGAAGAGRPYGLPNLSPRKVDKIVVAVALCNRAPSKLTVSCVVFRDRCGRLARMNG